MKTNLNELNAKYSACPVYENEYVINGQKFIVHSHFVGSKDIDKVIGEIAFNHAVSDTVVA